jgi:hypothetical protein
MGSHSTAGPGRDQAAHREGAALQRRGSHGAHIDNTNHSGGSAGSGGTAGLTKGSRRIHFRLLRGWSRTVHDDTGAATSRRRTPTLRISHCRGLRQSRRVRRSARKRTPGQFQRRCPPAGSTGVTSRRGSGISLAQRDLVCSDRCRVTFIRRRSTDSPVLSLVSAMHHTKKVPGSRWDGPIHDWRESG